MRLLRGKIRLRMPPGQAHELRDAVPRACPLINLVLSGAKAVLDVFDSFQVLMVPLMPLDLDGPYKVLDHVDRAHVDTSYSILVGGTSVKLTGMNESVLLQLCVAGDDQTFTMK